MRVEIELLTGHTHLAPALASWHHAEWGHLYDPAVWDLATAALEFEAMAEPGSADRTWVAFAGDGRGVDDALGSISLLATDDLAEFEHLTPWLASLYVTVAARGRGVGGALVDALIAGAAAMGHAYVHLFTSGQEAFYLERGWRAIATTDTVGPAGHRATVMAKGTHARAARRATCSHWCGDPDTNGAYSYLRIGGRPEHRDVLAGPILPGLWLAGEATSRAYPATMHGAWFSGERAADQAHAEGSAERVIVVGAGIAGMIAARRLHARGHAVIVLESKPAPGGRITADTSLGVPVPLGGAWLHGEIDHPLAPMVTWVEEEWADRMMFVVGHGQLDEGEIDEMQRAYCRVNERFAASEPSASVGDVMAMVLAEMTDLAPPVRAGVESWLTIECESLFAAPVGDIQANGGFEEYRLDGDDRLITSSLDDVIDQLAAGLDVRCDHRVAALTFDGAQWHTDTGLAAGAVIVTVPIGALRTGRIAFSPPLPDRVIGAIALLGAGPVTKIFATYDEAWWPPERPLRFAGQADLLAVTDMTDLTGVPTLCAFATGDAARRIEQLSEHELCLLLDRAITETGLQEWDR